MFTTPGPSLTFLRKHLTTVREPKNVLPRPADLTSNCMARHSVDFVGNSHFLCYINVFDKCNPLKHPPVYLHLFFTNDSGRGMSKEKMLTYANKRE